MSAFITYDQSTGIIHCAYSVSHSDDLSSIMAANTPSGASSLAVEDGHAVLTNQHGWQVKSGALVSVPLSNAEQLVKARSDQRAIIEASYQNATYNTPIGYMGTTFWTDQASRELVLTSENGYTRKGATPAGFAWWDAAGSPVTMTLAELQGLYDAILAMSESNFIKRKTLLASIVAATTVAKVQAITW